jgi:L,D-peptidoglycan transpeptidase YkuD (ErfK/YbiS/YcfS/YnhG family)
VHTTTRPKPVWLAAATLVLAATSVLVGPPGATSAATPTVPERLTVPVGNARQLIVVSSAGWSSTSAVLTTWERSANGWQQVHGPFTARIGRNGFKVEHVEGDGTAPAGSFPITGIMGRQPDPGVRYPYRRLTPGDCWISDAGSPAYNTLVRAEPCRRPNEDLYAIGAGAYRYAAITGYNTAPVVAGRGSAIFLHRHSYGSGGATKATSGCVSLAEPALLTVLRWLDPAKQPRIAMGPESWLLRPDASAASATITRWLRIGTRGAEVAVLQRRLGELGFPAVADGVFGNQTAGAVRAFQRSRALVVDGVVGPQTGRALGVWAG